MTISFSCVEGYHLSYLGRIRTYVGLFITRLTVWTVRPLRQLSNILYTRRDSNSHTVEWYWFLRPARLPFRHGCICSELSFHSSTSDRIRTYIFNSITINRLEGGLDYRGIYFSSSYGIRTHIVGLEDQCPIQLNEGTICRHRGI